MRWRRMLDSARHIALPARRVSINVSRCQFHERRYCWRLIIIIINARRPPTARLLLFRHSGSRYFLASLWRSRLHERVFHIEDASLAPR